MLLDFFKIYGLGLCAAVVILAIAYQFAAPAPPKRFSIATASKDGAYYAFAQQYKKLFAAEKIDLQIIETSGSVENLKLLRDRKVEAAFLQGGIGSSEEGGEIEGLASLYLEPLWIFLRKELKVGTLSDLAGMRVAIGAEGSGTREIALQLFNDVNITSGNSISFVPLGGDEGARALLDNQVDALLMVTGAGAPLVKELVLHQEVQLVNLDRAEAYTRLHRYLSHVVLPEGLLDMENNVPSDDIHLVAPAATLVASDTLHPALIDLLMQFASRVHQKRSILAGAVFPSPEYLDFPLNQEAERFFKHGPPFLQRYLPFWAASLIDRMKFMVLPLVALVLPLIKILPPTYRWRIRSRIYRWYDELHALDLRAREYSAEEDIGLAIEALNDLEQEVRQVEVPLAYGEELYNLRLHIDLLRRQLQRLLLKE